MRKGLKRTMISMIAVLALLLSALPAEIISAAGQDITDMLSDLKVNLTVGGQPVIVDGEPVPDSVLPSYSVVELSISWELAQESFYGKTQAGDYFDISLPYNAMSFNIINNAMPLEYNGEILGHWTVLANSPIHFVLTDEGAQKLSLEGVFKFYGVTRTFESSATTRLVFNDLIIDIPSLPIDPTPPTDGFLADNYGLYPLEETPIFKDGYQYEAGVKNLLWYINVNNDNAAKAMKKEPFEVLNAAYLEDKLEGSQTIDDIWIVSQIYYPFSTGGPSESTAYTFDFTSEFPQIKNTAGLPDEEFLQSIRTSGVPCYGLSESNDHIVVSFGDIPGNGLKYAKNDAAFRSELPDELSEEEKDMIIERMGETGLAQGAVLNYTVYLATTTTGEQNVFSNTAKFAHSKGADLGATGDIIMTQISGSISGLDPNSVRLIKSDAESGAKLAGAVFKLQKKDGNGDFQDYGTQKTTDEDGIVEYKNIPEGVYRFVEVSAADGYDIESVKYSAEQFAIIEGEEGILIKALNEKSAVVEPPVKNIELGWMRSTELPDESYLVNVETGSWDYNSAFGNTPIKYFENTQVQNKANEKAAGGTEVTRPKSEQLVGIEHIWDKGTYFDKYKLQNGSSSYGWASWKHWGVSGSVKNKGEYSIRRFSAYFEMDDKTLNSLDSAFLAPEDELGNMSYLFPVNDSVFVFVNGELAYWGGTDVVEGQNQYEALNRTIFMGQPGIKVRNGVNGLFKHIYPHTDGWCIDLEANKDMVNIKNFLKPGFNRIDIFADEYWEGGGMNKVQLYLG